MPDIKLSICIVTFRARDYLRECLRSIFTHTQGLEFEIIVVDNGSGDGTVEMLHNDFPEAIHIENQRNLGFGKPTNQAMKISRGKYILWINPDTIIMPKALNFLVDFLDQHSKVGIVGPKVLNPDGTLQKPCRRSEARPWDVFTYFTGLANIFPRSKRFSGYYMGYRDENETHEVHGVSGSCMLIRRDVIESVGLLDEQFFAYQEDADYCLRTRKAGWQVMYYPKAKITHYGGQGGSKVQPYRSIWEWHRSYFLYYRKHFAKDYFFLFNWCYYFAMIFKLIFSLLKSLLSDSEFGGQRKPG